MIEESRRANNIAVHDKRNASTTNPIEMLQELFNLLEDYAPLWYSQETHDRVLRTLVRGTH